MFRLIIAALDRNTAALNALARVGLALLAEGQDMTAAFDSLTNAVTNETTVEASAVTLIESLAAEMKASSSDPAVQALADRITASSAALAKAVSANTPASTAPAANVAGAAPGNADVGPDAAVAGAPGATGA